jgi:hypothetical protein
MLKIRDSDAEGRHNGNGRYAPRIRTHSACLPNPLRDTLKCLTRLLSDVDVYIKGSHANMNAQRTTPTVPLPRSDGLPSHPPDPPPRLPFGWTPPTRQHNSSIPPPVVMSDGQLNRLAYFAAEHSARVSTSSIRDSFQNHLKAHDASGDYLDPLKMG